MYYMYQCYIYNVLLPFFASRSDKVRICHVTSRTKQSFSYCHSSMFMGNNKPCTPSVQAQVHFYTITGFYKRFPRLFFIYPHVFLTKDSTLLENNFGQIKFKSSWTCEIQIENPIPVWIWCGKMDWNGIQIKFRFGQSWKSSDYTYNCVRTHWNPNTDSLLKSK